MNGEKIIEKIEDIDTHLKEYIKEAWKNPIPNVVDTLAILNFETLEVNYVNYEPNSHEFIYIYT